MLNDKVDWRYNDKCIAGGTKASFKIFLAGLVKKIA